jgi:hypothetical protein
MNWKNMIKDYWIVIVVVMGLLAIGLVGLTSNEPNLMGASWECESCQNPILIGYTCDYPAFANVTDSYKCLITCADNSTIVTQCLKERLIRYTKMEKNY